MKNQWIIEQGLNRTVFMLVLFLLVYLLSFHDQGHITSTES